MNDPQPIPDRSRVLTEQRNAASRDLDKLSVAETLLLINDEDARVAAAVRVAIPALTPLVDAVVAAMKQGGRLIYFGAGTSGRLGVLDASECPPTFHTDPSMVVGIIAGGDGALRKSVEGAEDDPDGIAPQFDELKVGKGDVVVGIAAGGTTPYVIGGLKLAKTRGAATGLIACAKAPAGAADHIVELLVGPEVVTGSTRMKAGTATKLALNMVTTTAMVQLGKTWGNLMVDLRVSNAKLIDRGARILTSQCGVSRDEALALLKQTSGRVKLALVMAGRKLDAAAAQRLLDQHGGRLREILGEPK
ncbi:MAG: N-acetylmuramic acid 6-phosphate etherase [Planctomycetes bacterium]|nr:N-acetylmuramic acid 6-phosphate etherase [Planctomycetota bacterium]